MEQYKQEFIEFMVDCNVLKFGDFTTKSGRKTPFFINTGFYRTGEQLKKLGEFYAKAVADNFGTDFVDLIVWIISHVWLILLKLSCIVLILISL